MASECAGSLVIYDGTFGPPHKGHVRIAQLLTQLKDIPQPVKVVINVAGELGKAGAWPAHDRLEAARAAFSTLGDHAVISDFYITAGEREKRYICTSEAVQHLREDYAGFKVYMSGGADNFTCELFKNKRPDALKRIIATYDGFIILPRMGCDVDVNGLKSTLLSLVHQDEAASANATRLHIVCATGFEDKGWSSTILKKFLFFCWAIQRLPEDMRRVHCPDYHTVCECLGEMMTEETRDFVMPGGVVKDLYAANCFTTASTDALHSTIIEFKAQQQNGVEPSAKRRSVG